MHDLLVAMARKLALSTHGVCFSDNGVISQVLGKVQTDGACPLLCLEY